MPPYTVYQDLSGRIAVELHRDYADDIYFFFGDRAYNFFNGSVVLHESQDLDLLEDVSVVFIEDWCTLVVYKWFSFGRDSSFLDERARRELFTLVEEISCVDKSISRDQ